MNGNGQQQFDARHLKPQLSLTEIMALRQLMESEGWKVICKINLIGQNALQLRCATTARDDTWYERGMHAGWVLFAQAVAATAAESEQPETDEEDASLPASGDSGGGYDFDS